MSPEAKRVVRWLADYWIRNPQAGDSVTGIAEYWLRDEPCGMEQVQEALSEMVAMGWIDEMGGLNGQRHYRSSPPQVELMKRFLSSP